jgi:uncharacterized membrane protein YphA (DoxX/SURF4 family)/peroxiredoxin
MDVALLVARLVLAVVLAAAGLAKLAEGAGARSAVTEFGLPAGLASPLALVLPLAELAIASALVWDRAAVAGAIAAAAVLAVFTAAITLNLALGRRPECHCFGQLSSEPAGGPAIARNVVLGALAAWVAVAGPGASADRAVAWVGDLTPAELGALAGGLVLIAVLALQWWFLVNLLRQNGRLLERLEAIEAHLRIAPSRADRAAPGLSPGRPAPDFTLPGRDGRTRSLGSLLGVAGGKPLLLVFSDPDCGPCADFLPELLPFDDEHASGVTLALITRESGSNGDVAAVERRLRHVLLQEGREVMEAYGVPGTPSGVLVDGGGMISSRLALGPDAIRGLLASAVGTARPRPAG